MNQIDYGRYDYKEVEGIDFLTKAGKAALDVKMKAKGIFGEDLLIFRLIDFVTFFQLNTKFCSKGIFITEENREEKYIEIIETEDETLIADLEKFIELNDNLKILNSKKEEYYSVIEKLKMLSDYDDEESINGIIKEYVNR